MDYIVPINLLPKGTPKLKSQSLKKIVGNLLDDLYVPYQDSCCNELESRPVRTIDGVLQTLENFEWVDVPMGEGGSGELLDNISDLTSYTGDADTLGVNQLVRGGIFNKYSGAQTADNGVIFLDANGQKWKREISTNYINVKWYPVVENTAMDSIFTQIMTAATNKENIPFPNIYFPATVSGYYFFNSTITINTKVNIFGDGRNSYLRWSANVKGMIFNYITSRYSKLENLLLSGGTSAIASGSPLGSNWTTTAHGIEFRDIIYAKGLYIEQFAGDGYYLYGDSVTANVNNSVFERCIASQNRLHGWYTQGSDANKIKFINCESRSNGASGFMEKSFLGNEYYSPESSSNGSPEITWQRGLVKTAGNLVYAAIEDGVVGIEPGVTVGWETSWQLLSGSTWWGFSPVALYDNTRVYYAVGAYNFIGASQYSTLYSPYAEADQATSSISGRTLVINPNFVPRTNTAALQANQGALYTLSSIWAGNPGADSTKRSYLTPNALGVRYDANHGLAIAYDTTRNVTVFRQESQPDTTNAAVLLTDSQTTAANAGRSTGMSGGTFLLNKLYMNTATSRVAYSQIDLSLTAPSTTGLDYGDFYLLTAKQYFHHKPEAIVSKYLEPSIGGTKKLFTIKGFQEDILTNVTGTYAIGTDYNVANDHGILYDVTFVGSNATDSCVIHREILWVIRAGTSSIVDNTPVRPDYVPGGFASTAFSITTGATDDPSISLINLPAGTNGKVNIKRIDY